MYPIIEFGLPDTRDAAFRPWVDGENVDLSKNAFFKRGFYHTCSEAHGMFAGEATLRAFNAEVPALPVDLFLIVVEGELAVSDAQGRVTRLAKGETAAFPRGLSARWTQGEDTRVFFMLHDGPAGAGGEAGEGSHALEVVVPKLDETLDRIDGPAAELVVTSPRPSVGRKVIYTGAGGRFTVGLWEATSYTRKLAAFGDFELMYFIEGEVEITNALGESRVFRPHETFLVNRGVSNAWKTTGPVRKVYCKVSPLASG